MSALFRRIQPTAFFSVAFIVLLLSGFVSVPLAKAAPRDTVSRNSFPAALDPIVQQSILTAPDGVQGDYMGYGVWANALDGDTAVAGVYAKSNYTGAVYIYTRNQTTWSLAQELFDPNPATGENFGCGVAISGDTLFISAPLKNAKAGLVYVYTRNNGTWTQQASFTASDTIAENKFGSLLVLSGNRLFVSAYKPNGQGAVYVLTGSGTTWTEQQELTVTGGGEFGASVAVSGNTLVSSIYGGVIYVFIYDGALWTQQSIPTIQGSPHAYQVAIENDTIVIADNNYQHNDCNLFVYTRSGTTWTLQQIVQPDQYVGVTGMPLSLVLDGNIIYVSVPASYDVQSPSGTVFIFATDGTTWKQQASFLPTAVTPNFFSLTKSGNTLLGGAPNANGQAGAMYVYTVNPIPTQLAFTMSPSDTQAGTPFAQQPSVMVQDANGKMVMDYTGNVSIAIKNGVGPNGASLNGTTTAMAVNGIATFSDLSIDMAGQGYLLTATSDTLNSADSSPFEVFAAGYYVAMQLRSADDKTTAAAGPYDATLLVHNLSGSDLPDGTQLTFTLTGLRFKASDVTLSSNVTLQKARPGTIITSLQTGLANGASMNIALHIGALENSVPVKGTNTSIVRAAITYKVGKKVVSYSSNSVRTTIAKLSSDSGTNGALQPLVIKSVETAAGSKVTLTFIGTFFAVNEPITVTATPDASYKPVAAFANSSGTVRVLSLLGQPKGTYTVTIVGQWSGITGTGTFVLT